MGTMARYFSRRFAVAILGVFALCLLLIFMIDLIEMLRRAGKYGTNSGYAVILITLLRLPSFAELTLPFAVMIGSIGTFLALSRSSELSVVRSVGMSVWQFVFPGIMVAFLIGVAAVTLYNPLAALSKTVAEDLYAEAFGRKDTVFRTKGAGAWLRQDGEDGASIFNAGIVSHGGTKLKNVTVIQYDRQDRFVERVHARHAVLKDGFWMLSDATVTGTSGRPEKYKRYVVSSYLSPTQVQDSLGAADGVSFWDLPRFIETADKAGLPATKYKVQYQQLLVRPLLLVVMVLVAATCSLRAFRFGNIQLLILSGLGFGFAFFLFAEVSKNLGVSGFTTPALATWLPVLITALAASTVLLHQEDG